MKTLALLWFLASSVSVTHKNRGTGAQGLEEYQSLLIHNFIKNINWTNPDKTINIGILGNSKILSKINEKISKDKLNVTVRKIGFISEVQKFDIVFVPKSQSRSIAAVANQIESSMVLLIAEDKSIAKISDVCFYVESNKLKFIVNQGNTNKKGFTISTKLLQYAKLM